MLDINKKFKEALENFPKWMDIRKRAHKSRGGKYLLSLLEELSDVNTAILKMKKSFFLVNYKEIEDSVLAYVYIAQIGESLDIVVPYENLRITTDITEFYENLDSKILYQDGYLSVSESVAKKLEYKIEYILDERYPYKVDLSCYAIWNIFDEFAMFFGLERFENESNKELANRCYLVYKNRTNCSEQGLKNTIKNAVSNYTTVTDDEINFYNLNEIDIFQTEKEDKTIYDIVSELNKDIYRYKKWNHDVWNHDFAHIKYSPHVWDWKLRSFQNGTGNNDDCKIVLGSEQNLETTDVSVIGYKKSELLINEYIHNNNIEKVIPITLTKYNDVLKSNDVQFQITASEVQEIDPSKITIEQYESQEGTNKYYISDIINHYSDGITEVKKNILEANSSYKLIFESLNSFTDMVISKCKLVGPDKSLLEEKDQFVFDATGEIVNRDVIKHITNIQEFADCENMKNIEVSEGFDKRNAFTLGDESKRGSFSVYLNNAANQNIKLEYRCKTNDITNNGLYVNYSGFALIDSQTLHSDETDNDNVIHINMNCNYLSFEIGKEDIDSNQGSCNVLVTVDGKIDTGLSGIRTKPEKIVVNNGNRWLSVNVKITKIGNKPLTIKNIAASAFNIEYSLKEGELIVSKLGTMRLPNIKENILTVTVSSYGAYSPVFDYLHIGPALGYYNGNIFVPTAKYELDFSIEEETEIDIDSTCKVSLYKIKNGENTLISDNFITKYRYTNNNETEGYVSIRTDDFPKEYESNIEIKDGKIYLSQNESIQYIYIRGTTLKNISSTKLSKLVDMQDAKFYVANNINGVIRHSTRSNEDIVIPLSTDFLKIKADNIKVDVGTNQNVTVAFSINGEKVLIYGDRYSSDFSYVRLMNTNKQSYIAYNTISILMPTTKNIEMIHNFSPLLDENKLVMYQITSVSDNNTNIFFEKRCDDKIVLENWSLGKNELGLTAISKTDFTNVGIYDCEVKTEQNKYIISQNILFKAENIAEYIVTIPDNMKIHYDTKYYEESFYVEEDGFNKLRYSNIVNIEEVILNGMVLDKGWSILKDQGILVWNTSENIGQAVTVRYTYKEPVYMYYSNINDLYKIVGYSIDSYEAINKTPLIFTNLKDGDSVNISFENQKADKLVISCSNYQFIAQNTDNEKITVYHLDYQDKVAIHNGYLYQDGREYWLFANKFRDEHDNYNGVILDNVKRYGEQFLFSQTSTNFLPYSTMEKNTEREVCYIDFGKTERFGSVSTAGRLTVLNNYHKFMDSNMDIDLVSGKNGLAIKFTAKTNDAYSILEITNYLRKDSYLSILGQGVRIFLAEELDAETFKFTKSFCARIIEEVPEKNNIYSMHLTPYQTDKRMYLVFKNSGIIDDLIVKDKPISNNIHTRNIDKIGFSPSNSLKEGFYHTLDFTNNNKIFDLDVSNESDISCGSTVDWDLTQVYKLSEDENATTHGIQKRFNSYIATEDDAYILSSPIFVTNKQSIKDVIVKINELSESIFKDFTVSLYTFNSLSDLAKQLDKQSGENIFNFKEYSFGSYLQIKIEMKIGKVIHDADVLLKYREVENTPLVIKEQSSGYLLTQIYDTAYIDKNYVVQKINFSDIEGSEFIKIEVRGCKEGENDSVWTDWHEIEFIKEGKGIGTTIEPHRFEGYHLFQFKISLLNPTAKISMKNFILKVVS